MHYLAYQFGTIGLALRSPFGASNEPGEVSTVIRRLLQRSNLDINAVSRIKKQTPFVFPFLFVAPSVLFPKKKKKKKAPKIHNSSTVGAFVLFSLVLCFNLIIYV
jgi:hypothetical protein